MTNFRGLRVQPSVVARIARQAVLRDDLILSVREDHDSSDALVRLTPGDHTQEVGQSLWERGYLVDQDDEQRWGRPAGDAWVIRVSPKRRVGNGGQAVPGVAEKRAAWSSVGHRPVGGAA